MILVLKFNDSFKRNSAFEAWDPSRLMLNLTIVRGRLLHLHVRQFSLDCYNTVLTFLCISLNVQNVDLCLSCLCFWKAAVLDVKLSGCQILLHFCLRFDLAEGTVTWKHQLLSFSQHLKFCWNVCICMHKRWSLRTWGVSNWYFVYFWYEIITPRTSEIPEVSQILSIFFFPK